MNGRARKQLEGAALLGGLLGRRSRRLSRLCRCLTRLVRPARLCDRFLHALCIQGGSCDRFSFGAASRGLADLAQGANTVWSLTQLPLPPLPGPPPEWSPLAPFYAQLTQHQAGEVPKLRAACHLRSRTLRQSCGLGQRATPRPKSRKPATTASARLEDPHSQRSSSARRNLQGGKTKTSPYLHLSMKHKLAAGLPSPSPCPARARPEEEGDAGEIGRVWKGARAGARASTKGPLSILEGSSCGSDSAT